MDGVRRAHCPHSNYINIVLIIKEAGWNGLVLLSKRLTTKTAMGKT